MKHGGHVFLLLGRTASFESLRPGGIRARRKATPRNGAPRPRAIHQGLPFRAETRPGTTDRDDPRFSAFRVSRVSTSRYLSVKSIRNAIFLRPRKIGVHPNTSIGHYNIYLPFIRSCWRLDPRRSILMEMCPIQSAILPHMMMLGNRRKWHLASVLALLTLAISTPPNQLLVSDTHL